MNFTSDKPLYRLAELAAFLRGETGCPWDREQTSMTLRKYLVEETYETIDAIESGSAEHTVEELGDLLYQIYAHSQIAQEQGLFTIDDVAQGIINKLIRRHPHVFADESLADGDAVAVRWENIKKQEKNGKESILDGIPLHLPALLKSYRAQEKASRLGFDWKDISGPEEKLDEELREFREAITLNDKNKIFDELGDILFSIVNVARHLKIDPEEALQSSTKKFINRFKHVEKAVHKTGREMNSMPLEELDEFWNQAKKEL